MKTLKTHNTNKEILIDDFNYERLKNLKIHDNKKGNLQIMYTDDRGKYLGGIPLTKIILLTDKPVIDHKDRNSFNCLVSNLRPCFSYQNFLNKSKKKDNTSGYKGVSFYKKLNKWKAAIQFRYKYYFLGYFNTKEEAARAYDKKAKELFGEFAVLNFPNE